MIVEVNIRYQPVVPLRLRIPPTVSVPMVWRWHEVSPPNAVVLVGHASTCGNTEDSIDTLCGEIIRQLNVKYIDVLLPEFEIIARIPQEPVTSLRQQHNFIRYLVAEAQHEQK